MKTTSKYHIGQQSGLINSSYTKFCGMTQEKVASARGLIVKYIKIKKK
jgi:hypothetical protein